MDKNTIIEQYLVPSLSTNVAFLIRINFNCLMRFNQVIHFTRLILTGVKFMQWTKPAFTDLRIGFEVTMYFEAR